MYHTAYAEIQNWYNYTTSSSSSLSPSPSSSCITSQYDKVGKLMRDFHPYKNLWVTVADWLKWHETWMNASLINIDPELLASNASNAFKTMHKSVQHFRQVMYRVAECC